MPATTSCPSVNLSATRAITIKTAADHVWPWIAQLGQGRGGFYSYDWLENLVAHIDIHNADRIVPEWQHLAVGSEVRLAPELPLQVAALERGRALVLRGNVPMGKVTPPYDFTWAFVLLPQPDGTTRLVVRERYEYTRRWAALIVQPAQLVSCLMSPKMLRGIKSRAERHAARTARPEPQLPPDRPPVPAGPSSQPLGERTPSVGNTLLRWKEPHDEANTYRRPGHRMPDAAAGHRTPARRRCPRPSATPPGATTSGYFETSLTELRTPTEAITAETPTLTTDLQTPTWVIDALDTDLRLRVTAAEQRRADLRRDRTCSRRRRVPGRRRPRRDHRAHQRRHTGVPHQRRNIDGRSTDRADLLGRNDIGSRNPRAELAARPTAGGRS